MRIYTQEEIETLTKAADALSALQFIGSSTIDVFPTHEGIMIATGDIECEKVCSMGKFFTDAIFTGGCLNEELTMLIIKDLSSTLRHSKELDDSDNAGHGVLYNKIKSDANKWKLGWAKGEY